MKKFLLFYHTAMLAVAEGQTDAAPTLADIKATRASLSTERRANVYVRDVTKFDGIAESGVDGLLFLEYDGIGMDDRESFQRVYEAYAPYEVEVEGVGLHQPEASSESDDAESAPTGLNELMAEATALGLQFSPQIGEETLRKRVEAEKAKIAKIAEASK